MPSPVNSKPMCFTDVQSGVGDKFKQDFPQGLSIVNPGLFRMSALDNIDRAVVLISYVRYFISKADTTIVAIEGRKIIKNEGDYKFYIGSRIGNVPVIDLEELAKPQEEFCWAKTVNIVTSKDKGIKNAKRKNERNAVREVSYIEQFSVDFEDCSVLVFSPPQFCVLYINIKSLIDNQN